MKGFAARYVVGAIALAIALAGCGSPQAWAASLKVQPLQYNATLAKGEVKKGFIDISNPSGSTLHLATSVQAFRQTDDDGSLEFYDNPQVAAGITPDFAELTLLPRRAIRMYFLVQADKLPSGNVFAALFVSSKATEGSGSEVLESVKLGTLISLVNGTPPSQHAAIVGVTAPLFQFGSGVTASYRVKNTAQEKQATGFYPRIQATLKPLGLSRQTDGPLVFASRTRQREMTLPASVFGVYYLNVAASDGAKGAWVIAVTGYWRWLSPLLLAVLAVGLWGARHRKKHR